MEGKKTKVRKPPDHQCDVCDKKFGSSYNLSEHKRTHTGEKPFECDICSKAFTGSSNFAKHKRMHTGEKPFECDQCGKKFAQSSHLSEHKRIHTGEKPFECDHCSKKFTRSTHLTRHKKSCKEITESRSLEFTSSSSSADDKGTHRREKPFECDHCSKKFTRLTYLSRHKKSCKEITESESRNLESISSQSLSGDKISVGVKPFKCDVCNKTFTSSSNMVKHKRTHTGEKPFECYQCDKKFTQSSHLSEHKRIHTGEKPFECDHCSKKFTRSTHLTRHKKSCKEITKSSNLEEPGNQDGDDIHAQIMNAMFWNMGT